MACYTDQHISIIAARGSALVSGNPPGYALLFHPNSARVSRIKTPDPFLLPPTVSRPPRAHPTSPFDFPEALYQTTIPDRTLWANQLVSEAERGMDRLGHG